MKVDIYKSCIRPGKHVVVTANADPSQCGVKDTDFSKVTVFKKCVDLIPGIISVNYRRAKDDIENNRHHVFEFKMNFKSDS